MVKLLIVTGYLGSGKTTLLRELQDYLPKGKCHFIVNEAGEVALDQASYEMVRETITVVSGGCACCVKKEQLLESVKKIVNCEVNIGKNEHYIVVETSGLANPAPIIFSVKSDQYLKHHVDVMGVVCVLGSVEGQDALEHYDEVGQQLAMADAVVMTKSDLVTADRLEMLRGIVNAIAVGCPVFIAQNGTANWSSIIGGLESNRGLVPDSFETQSHSGDISGQKNRSSSENTSQQLDETGGQHAGMSTCVLRVEGALDWVAFGIWLSALLATYGESIVRVKGVVRVSDWDGQKFFVLINGVQHIIYPPRHIESTELSEDVALVFIMKNITSNEVVESLRQFLQRYLDDQPVHIWAE